MSFLDYYKNRKVLVTGHTGFKGSWLTLWLSRLGANVTGWSIDVPTSPSLFEQAGISDHCDHRFGNINDFASTARVMADGKFDIIFHLAAQPLVRLSYSKPLETAQTNIIGTANVLEAVRQTKQPCSVVAVTSDKCYANNGSIWGFRECDPIGGTDPYSMSKGAAELVIDSWRNSYFRSDGNAVRLASARAGNVIGGGDWAADRIITDCVNALMNEKTVEVRNPLSTRPWQHVLEPLSGYLWLGAVMGVGWQGRQYDTSWNFGPQFDSVRPVSELVECLISCWGSGSWNHHERNDAMQEAATLSLNCEKSAHFLKWRPVWSFTRAISETAKWYRHFDNNGADGLKKFTQEQISSYVADATKEGLTWATLQSEQVYTRQA